MPVLCEGTRTQHESSQEAGHQQGQVQRGSEDEHVLLRYEPGGRDSEREHDHGDGGREDRREVRTSSWALRHEQGPGQGTHRGQTPIGIN